MPEKNVIFHLLWCSFPTQKNAYLDRVNLYQQEWSPLKQNIKYLFIKLKRKLFSIIPRQIHRDFFDEAEKYRYKHNTFIIFISFLPILKWIINCHFQIIEQAAIEHYVCVVHCIWQNGKNRASKNPKDPMWRWLIIKD